MDSEKIFVSYYDNWEFSKVRHYVWPVRESFFAVKKLLGKFTEALERNLKTSSQGWPFFVCCENTDAYSLEDVVPSAFYIVPIEKRRIRCKDPQLAEKLSTAKLAFLEGWLLKTPYFDDDMSTKELLEVIDIKKTFDTTGWDFVSNGLKSMVVGGLIRS